MGAGQGGLDYAACCPIGELGLVMGQAELSTGESHMGVHSQTEVQHPLLNSGTGGGLYEPGPNTQNHVHDPKLGASLRGKFGEPPGTLP